VQKKLRSTHWFGLTDRDGFIHRSWMKNQGFPADVFDGRPVIGICNTWSELTPCNAHLRQVADRVKRGVWEAGGFPLEFPVMSLGETNIRPTAMLFRNLASMDVEESIRGNPIDGVVLLCGCDKTTPSLMMGAASCDLPAIVVSGGPMLNGRFQDQTIGSGTSVWQMSEDVRAGKMKAQDFFEAEQCQSRSAGHCMSMGTASTMACMVEALGMGLPQNAATPAVDSRRYVMAHMAGRRIVEMVHQDVKMSQILTREAFENAIMVNAAVGGSSNFVLHMLAIAGRVGVKLTLDDFDRIGHQLPLLVDIMPAGRFLMEDFFYAGGVPAIVRELGARIHRDAMTVNGKTIGENTADAPCWNREVIREIDKPIRANAGLAVVRGNLAPDGAVVKPSAATPRLLKHRGRAVVFESIEDFKARIDDPNLDVDENSVMVMKGAGPKGYPGMPEVGNMPLPPKLLAKGITDVVRVSDARMSGTAYGTVVLHVSPESAAGGALALVQNGDEIELDVAARKLELCISDEEMARRKSAWVAPAPVAESGYQRMYVDHVLQSHEGADLDFLVGCRGSGIPRESH
jgi:L-arabonate dehydrase